MAAALLLCGEESEHLDKDSLRRLSIMTFNAPKVFHKEDARRYEDTRKKHGVQHKRIEHCSDGVRVMPLRREHVGDENRRGEGVLENPVVRGLGFAAAALAVVFAAACVHQTAKAHSCDDMPEGSSDEEEGSSTRRGRP